MLSGLKGGIGWLKFATKAIRQFGPILLEVGTIYDDEDDEVPVILEIGEKGKLININDILQTLDKFDDSNLEEIEESADLIEIQQDKLNPKKWVLYWEN